MRDSIGNIMDKLIIYAVKVEDKYYISSQQTGYSRIDLDQYYFDNKKPEKSFDDKWFIVSGKPFNITKKQSQPDINYRYVMIDDTLVGNNRPLELTIDEACYEAKCGDRIWKDKYSPYKSLYVMVSDKQPDIDIEIEFEWHEIGEVEPFQEPKDFNYSEGRVWRSYSSNYEDGYIRKSDIIHQTIDRAIFPSFLIHTKPCKLSAKNMYSIIREHVKTNIDSKYARVSSDYDFSFEVMKRISLAKPYETTRNYTPPHKRKPITQTTLHEVREQKIFRMAESKGDYVNVPEIEGRDENELKEKIDDYLKQLMDEINDPIIECSYCNGTGVKQKDIS